MEEYLMNSMSKKIMAYTLVGMMQVGIGTAVVAASPLYNDGSQRIVQLDARDDNGQPQPDQHQHKHKPAPQPQQPQPDPNNPG